MKLWIVLMLFAVAAAAPSSETDLFDLPTQEVTNAEERNALLNALIRQLFVYLRYVIRNGSYIFNTRPLDPFILDEFRLYLPAVLINLDLNLKNAVVTGLGDFVVHKSTVVDMSNLSFELEISVPRLDISAEMYDLVGDLYSAIPLYGKGRANFVVENFRFRTMMFLKQSEDGRSVLIDRLEGTSFEIPYFKSDLTGAIGGGDIDAIVNAVIDDVIINYVNRFQGAISLAASKAVVAIANPILDHLDTWKYLIPFIRN